MLPEFAEGLKDLAGFSHVILLYHLHGAQRVDLTVTPFLDATPHGVVATRAPNRPNPNGLSVVRLEAIELTQGDLVVRIGVPPVRLEIHTSITGVEFDNCYPARLKVDMQGLDVPFISLDDLLTNKRRAGRHKDLDDVEHLTYAQLRWSRREEPICRFDVHPEVDSGRDRQYIAG